MREKRWGFWHPYLPFLGDEVTGKTVAIIGTGRIGLAMIKKCAGFDMNILCYDPAYQNHEYIRVIQETNDLRHARGICREKTWIRYVSWRTRWRSGFCQRTCSAASGRGESDANLPSFQRANFPQDEEDVLSGEYLARPGGGRSCAGKSPARKLDCRGGARRL